MKILFTGEVKLKEAGSEEIVKTLNLNNIIEVQDKDLQFSDYYTNLIQDLLKDDSRVLVSDSYANINIYILKYTEFSVLPKEDKISAYQEICKMLSEECSTKCENKSDGE